MGKIRVETRMGAEGRATATILGHPDIRVACGIRDVSKSGMCIQVKEKISEGKIVKVEWGDHFLVGRVQRVSTAAANYVVGLELLYCSKWNEPIASALAEAGSVA
jgi:hypothetical protein